MIINKYILNIVNLFMMLTFGSPFIFGSLTFNSPILSIIVVFNEIE